MFLCLLKVSNNMVIFFLVLKCNENNIIWILVSVFIFIVFILNIYLDNDKIWLIDEKKSYFFWKEIYK